MTRKCKHQDLTGKKFGKLTVVHELPYRNKHGLIQWLCSCECGNETIATTSSLNSGHRTSCGCRKSLAFTNNKRLYNVWRGMLTRCENKNSDRYRAYGGRGISVCDEWHDFENFLNWATENGYDSNAETRQCTIDRINVDGNYEPDNCRWVDMRAQMRNSRCNHTVTINGETISLVEAAERFGISINTVRARVYSGWSEIDAVTIPPSRSANYRRASTLFK